MNDESTTVPLRQLERVRERRHDDAHREMRQKRDAFLEGMRAAEAAQGAVRAALSERAAFLQRLRESAAKEGVAISGLLDAQAWQASFDARIARANAALAQALDIAGQRRAEFEQSRRLWAQAQARLTGTRELIDREQAAARADIERREEEAAEEAALRVWQRGMGAGIKA